MSGAGARPGAAPALPRGGLWPALREATRRARAAGALISWPSETLEIEDRGVRFVVRMLGALDATRRPPAAGAGANPFLPYDPRLFVADVSPTHVAILNKYNVVEHHLLIVTRRFVTQETLLDADDWTALWTGLAEIDGLGFFNAGAIAGASQPHKHLQIVPTPLGGGPGVAPVPLEPWLVAARGRDGVGRSRSLPFPHAVARTEALAARPPAEAGPASLPLYRALLAAAGCRGEHPAYNLLVTRRHAWLVPRVREAWEGIAVNALGFAGALLVRGRRDLDRLRSAGPLAVLRGVAAAEPTGAAVR